jgi:hypothetical protein
MATLNLAGAALTSLLALLTLPLHGQINAPAVKLLPKSSPLVASAGKGQSAPKQRPVHPPRLSNADYALLRPQLAALLKVPPPALPPNPVQATNLLVPGNVLNVKIAGQNPNGASWYCDKASVSNVTSGSVATGFALSPMILGMVDAGPTTISFAMQNLPQGTYLMTAYVSGDRSSFDCKVGHTSGQTPLTSIPVQSGKVMVPFVLANANEELRLVLEIPWNNDHERDRYWVVYSCDFMRIQ